MNIPITFGWPQIILFIVALIGLGLLISMVTSIFLKEVEKYDEELEDGTRRKRYVRRRRFKWHHGVTGTILLAIAVLLLSLTLVVQTYLGLTSDVKVAEVRATMTNLQHVMSVEVVLYDQNGHTVSDNTYIMMGDEWELQGDILKFPSWLNIVGLHTGYKLARLEGRYDDPNMERNNKHTVIVLNGGDDGFFKSVLPGGWYSPFVEAAYGNAVILGANGQTYNVFVSQTGLYAKAVG